MARLQLIYSIAIVALVFAIFVSIPTSLGHKHKHKKNSDDEEVDAKKLCDDVSKKHQARCLKIIKSQDCFKNVDDKKDLTKAIIKLARAKACNIRDELKKFCSKNSKKDKLKSNYKACSKNYNGIIRDLDQAKKNLDSDDFHDVRSLVDHAFKTYKKCEKNFNKSCKPAGTIKKGNKDFEVHIEIVKAAAKCLDNKDADDDRDDD